VEAEILNVDYNEYVYLLGTAHFTRRSLLEAHEAVRQLKPTDLAIELDTNRFQLLNQRCGSCSKRKLCAGRCEFVGATDVLGNVDANIWLIDMSEREIADRIGRFLPHSRMWWFSMVDLSFWHRDVDDEVQLWEKGHKDEILERHARKMKVLRARAPHVWRVLIDERNTLMAARLAWIVTQKLIRDTNVKVLALTGAAHVAGIRELLASPMLIKDNLRELKLKFEPPRLIRRVSVN